MGLQGVQRHQLVVVWFPVWFIVTLKMRRIVHGTMRNDCGSYLVIWFHVWVVWSIPIPPNTCHNKTVETRQLLIQNNHLTEIVVAENIHVPRSIVRGACTTTWERNEWIMTPIVC